MDCEKGGMSRCDMVADDMDGIRKRATKRSVAPFLAKKLAVGGL